MERLKRIIANEFLPVWGAFAVCFFMGLAFVAGKYWGEVAGMVFVALAFIATGPTIFLVACQDDGHGGPYVPGESKRWLQPESPLVIYFLGFVGGPVFMFLGLWLLWGLITGQVN